ncbi:hypothetical protein [Nocardia beijingensis]|uniref:hypothetical protein n=1 Tax=Nocardia beijingensis TaxID=95162 RepID=UPI002B4B090B|nr:hypothetical protein [Nocardia beijingensis]
MVSLLTGQAIAAGRLHEDDRLVRILPELTTGGPYDAVTIRDLLDMASGVDVGPALPAGQRGRVPQRGHPVQLLGMALARAGAGRGPAAERTAGTRAEGADRRRGRRAVESRSRGRPEGGTVIVEQETIEVFRTIGRG